MAKYNSSPFGNISGEVLGVVASSNKGIKFLRNKGKAADAKTEKQLARRAIYGEFCTLWREKKLDIAVQSYSDAYLREEIFKDVLSFTLKHSENASLLWLTVCPTRGTMSAPVFTKVSVTPTTNNVLIVEGAFLFPAFDNSGNFELFSGYFGQEIYNYSRPKVALAVYPQGEISSREKTLTVRTPNTTQNLFLGQKVFRSYWYVNKKTGQVSKPICMACDESGNVETFFPFGK